MMKNPSCPNCEKAVQHRHTYMSTFPLTLVCAGCGSWLQLDVKRTGSFAVLLLSFATLGLAYFSAYFLILLPLYLVLSMGPLQSFSVDIIKKRKAEIWTINRRTGSLRPLNEAERDAERDVQLSNKLTGVQPFKVLPGKVLSPSSREQVKAHGQKRHSTAKRPEYNLDDLPTGLPH